jgi:hypothetical protein
MHGTIIGMVGFLKGVFPMRHNLDFPIAIDGLEAAVFWGFG